MHQEDEFGIISENTFKDYTGAWQSFMTTATADALTDLLRPTAGQYLPALTLPCQQLVWLLSTPRVQQVKVRFALLPAAAGQYARFAVALYATDADDAPVSAYYLAGGTWQPVPSIADACHVSLEDGPVPLALADTWLGNWAGAALVTPDMFNTTPGAGRTPLLGYNFAVRDFIDPLFALKSGLSDQTLCLNLGLHAYYGATAGAEVPAFRQVVGLVLQLAGTDVSEARYFDMSNMVPPGR